MPKVRKPIPDGFDLLYQRLIAGRPEREAGFERAHREAAIARKIHALRTSAGLTQQQLAKLVGTSTSVISRLEDADYDGHSLKTLHRIAAALDCVVEVRFVRRRQRGGRASA